MLFTLLFLADTLTPVPGRIQTHDLARVTWRQTEALNGQLVRVSFVVDSPAIELLSETLYDSTSLPGVSISVRFHNGNETNDYRIGQRVQAEGVLVTRVFPGRVEKRGAREIKP
jgi:hypothetical protein